jgi:hypothetical protein
METTVNKSSILTDLKTREVHLSKKVAELEDLSKELNEIRAAIKALGGTVNTSLMYNKDAPWGERIKFVLRSKGPGTVQDIIERILELEPEKKKDKDSVHNSVTTVASNLAGTGKLKAEKDGFRNIYSIIEE